MRLPTFLLYSFWFVCSAAGVRAQPVAGIPFPTSADIPELHKILSQESFDDPSHLARIPDGRLIEDVGFEKYAQCVYETESSGEVTVAIATLMDFRAAFSLLTLRSHSGMQQGPPGDAFTADSTGINFFQGKHWVRIDGPKASQGLLKRVAESVSSKLGARGQKPPSLINHLPRTGLDTSTIKYFPGLKSFDSYSGPRIYKSFHLNSDAEIAQARYAVDNQAGTLTLLNFPTPEVGEEYFADFSVETLVEKQTEKTYLKRAGPLVAVLKGRMDPGAADKILVSISHSYAIRWIYEKSQKKAITWGIPVRVLQTVVKSILFVFLLCVFAVVAGAGFALLRYVKRRRSKKDAPDWLGQTDSTRLRSR